LYNGVRVHVHIDTCVCVPHSHIQARKANIKIDPQFIRVLYESFNTHSHAYTHAHTHTHTHRCTPTHTHKRIPTLTYTPSHTNAHTHAHTRTHSGVKDLCKANVKIVAQEIVIEEEPYEDETFETQELKDAKRCTYIIFIEFSILSRNNFYIII